MRWKCFIPIVLLSMLIMGSSCDSNSSKKADAELNLIFTLGTENLKSDTIDLGVINKGEMVSGVFGIQSLEEDPVIVTQIISSCGCTGVEMDSKEPILQNTTRRINYSFDSKGKHGKQYQSIDILNKTANSDRRTLRIIILADVR